MINSSVKKVVAAQATVSLAGAFDKIAEYHEALGWPQADEPLSELQLQQHRDMCVALMAEAAEVLNAAPWKPWKNYALEFDGQSEQEVYDLVRYNVAGELVDILFFVGSLLEIWGLSGLDMDRAFHGKLEENYRRLQSGYNKPNTKESE